MILKLKSRGEQVKLVQEFLGIQADGIFGKKTESAVKKWQKDNGLIADGIVGPLTWSTMGSATTDITETLNNTEKGLLIHTHYLPSNEYFSDPSEKEWIFLHHTAGWQNPYHVIDSWGRDDRGRIATEFVIGGQSILNTQNNNDGVIVQSFPEKAYAWHLGIGNTAMHRNSVGIECCNFGYLTKGGYFKSVNGIRTWIARTPGEYYTYVGTMAHKDQIVKLSKPFRGYDHWHKYSEGQIQSLKDLLYFIANRDNIDVRKGLPSLIKQKGAEAFNLVDRDKCVQTKGIWSHSNVSPGKFDMFPQEELMEMLVGL